MKTRSIKYFQSKRLSKMFELDPSKPCKFQILDNVDISNFKTKEWIIDICADAPMTEAERNFWEAISNPKVSKISIEKENGHMVETTFYNNQK